jgi:hypothetical protein
MRSVPLLLACTALLTTIAGAPEHRQLPRMPLRPRFRTRHLPPCHAPHLLQCRMPLPPSRSRPPRCGAARCPAAIAAARQLGAASLAPQIAEPATATRPASHSAARPANG